MNKYSVRITNLHFTSVTVTAIAANKKEAERKALYGRHAFKVHWTKLIKKGVPDAIQKAG